MHLFAHYSWPGATEHELKTVNMNILYSKLDENLVCQETATFLKFSDGKNFIPEVL